MTMNKIKPIEFNVIEVTLTCETKPDLFSPKGLDSGTKMLLESVPKLHPKYSKVLDWGCGWGAIGLVLAKKKPESLITAIDSDIAAISATKSNQASNKIKNISVIPSHGFDEIDKNTTYDLIVSNPPTHRGREVVDNLIDQSHKFLSKNGILILVVESRLKPWVARSMKDSFGDFKVVDRSNRHVVISAIKKEI